MLIDDAFIGLLITAFDGGYSLFINVHMEKQEQS